MAARKRPRRRGLLSSGFLMRRGASSAPPAQTPPFPTTVVSEQLSPPPALGGTRPAATAEATPSPPPAIGGDRAALSSGLSTSPTPPSCQLQVGEQVGEDGLMVAAAAPVEAAAEAPEERSPAAEEHDSYVLLPADPRDFVQREQGAQQDDQVIFFQGDSADDGEGEELRHFDLKVVYDAKRNGLEETVNFPIDIDSVIAGRYRIMEYLGSGVFSRAVQCVVQSGRMVCIKIIRNNKARPPVRPPATRRPADRPALRRLRPLSGLSRPVARRDQAAAVPQRVGPVGRAARAAARRLLLPQGAPLHRVRAPPRQPVRVVQVQPRSRTGRRTSRCRACARSPTSASGARVHTRPQPDPLRPQAREHPHQVALALPRQGDRLWLVLLPPRPPLVLRAVALVPRARGGARPALLAED